ncbi:hypothetical protein BDW75DRAFT_202427 [Aspergillus navahoensis]
MSFPRQTSNALCGGCSSLSCFSPAADSLCSVCDLGGECGDQSLMAPELLSPRLWMESNLLSRKDELRDC